MTPSTSFHRTPDTWLAYLAVGLFAFFQSTLGPLMPALRQEMGFGYGMASLMFSTMAMGLVVMGFAGDRLVGHWGRRRTFRIGLITLGIAIITFAGSSTPMLSVIAVFGLGAGGALMGIAIQAQLAETQQGHRARAITELNLVSSLLAVGASVSIGLAERTAVGWRLSLYLGIMLLGVLAITSLRIPIANHTLVNPASTSGNLRGSLPARFWAFATIIFLGVSVDWCVAFWGAEFLNRTGGLSTAGAAAVMSFFFLAILAGRLAGSVLAGRVLTSGLLQVTLLVMLGGFTLFWVAPSPILAVTGLFLTGFGTANVFPFAYAAALDAASSALDRATSRLALVGGAAVLIPPFTLGLLANVVGIRWSLAVVPPLLLLALTIAVILARHPAPAPAQQQAAQPSPTCIE